MKVALFYKNSTYDRYLELAKENRSIAKFLNHEGETVKRKIERYKQGSENQSESEKILKVALDNLKIDYEMIKRGNGSDLAQAKGIDLVISVGGDGTFLEASHYIRETPILGYNTDTSRSIGFYSVANKENFVEIMQQLDSYPRTMLNRLEYLINNVEATRPTLNIPGKFPDLVLNDLRILRETAAGPLIYTINSGEESKELRGDGVLASTSSGSSAWIYNYGGEIVPLKDNRIQYVNVGLRGEGNYFTDDLEITSYSEKARILVDGLEEHLILDIGDELRIRQGMPLNVIGDIQKNQDAYVNKLRK